MSQNDLPGGHSADSKKKKQKKITLCNPSKVGGKKIWMVRKPVHVIDEERFKTNFLKALRATVF